jgi:hypothetical protein
VNLEFNMNACGVLNCWAGIKLNFRNSLSSSFVSFINFPISFIRFVLLRAGQCPTSSSLVAKRAVRTFVMFLTAVSRFGNPKVSRPSEFIDGSDSMLM